jgi:hypothetical protein
VHAVRRRTSCSASGMRASVALSRLEADATESAVIWPRCIRTASRNARCGAAGGHDPAAAAGPHRSGAVTSSMRSSKFVLVAEVWRAARPSFVFVLPSAAGSDVSGGSGRGGEWGSPPFCYPFARAHQPAPLQVQVHGGIVCSVCTLSAGRHGPTTGTGSEAAAGAALASVTWRCTPYG